MRTENIVGAVVAATLTAGASLLLLPRFKKHAKWREGGAAMSLRSRLILPLFPACGGLAIATDSAVWVVGGVLAWILLFISSIADRRRR